MIIKTAHASGSLKIYLEDVEAVIGWVMFPLNFFTSFVLKWKPLTLNHSVRENGIAPLRVYLIFYTATKGGW
jgi:hypothetical protein